MLELKPAFRAQHRKGEYARLEDMGLIGDGTTAALVSLEKQGKLEESANLYASLCGRAGARG
jgi:hypothetical protein